MDGRPTGTFALSAIGAFVQNLRRGHCELGVEALPSMTVAAAFDELAMAI